MQAQAQMDVKLIKGHPTVLSYVVKIGLKEKPLMI